MVVKKIQELQETAAEDRPLPFNSKHTAKIYEHYLKHYFECMAPSKGKDAVTQDKITRYLDAMKQQDGSSFGHRKNVMNALKYYCEMNNILDLNWRQIRRYLGEATVAFPDTREYFHEEIHKLLGVADPRYRAIILIFASSGMRLEPLTEIKLSDMEYLENYKIYKIKIYKGTPQQQICFTTPEAASAIKDYFKLNNIDEKGPGYFHHVSPHAVSKQISKLCVKAQLREIAAGARAGTTRATVPSVHGFRRFCITQMARAGVELEKRKLLTGHTIGVERSYARYSEDNLLQEYLKAVNLLTINEENRLRLKVKELTVKADEVMELRLSHEKMRMEIDAMKNK